MQVLGSQNQSKIYYQAISTYLDEVPFKISQKFQTIALEELTPSLLSFPYVPDCTEILKQAQYDFTLEKKVLKWVQDRLLQEPPRSIPTCPPFWFAFTDLEGEDTDDANNESCQAKPQRGHMVLRTRRCRSFSVTDIKHVCLKGAYVSDSESDDGYSEDDELSSSDENENQKLPSIPFLRSKFSVHSRFLDVRPASSPDNPSGSRHSEKCFNASLTRLPHISGLRRSPLCNNTDGEEESRRDGSSWSPAYGPRKPLRKFTCQHPNNKNSRNINLARCIVGSPPLSSAHYHMERSSMNRARPSFRKYKEPFQPLRNNFCLPVPPKTPRPLSSHKPLPDSTADLLLALSQKEQDLIQPAMKQGYPISRVIWAIQNVGQSSTKQILKYLSVWDRLCKEGYKESLVEEAMEIFQNSEEKAEEFLTLMTQFDEMGFQHEDIKEVLLIHNNHREKALEELMTRSR
ncbi:ubiquitin-associated protein 1-like isoform X1 [Hypanus sabinus]|uniref:ubiquitin-associated protein 1-like isoform X1 n=1 Tax=Hypanus sabinus TaxID=79690 RepID=UPI0028C4B605|nr:ubiquitin-associated protein 1-like isoform X1 [Hypanus sabinus]XP_059808806.1 ubiquitin-associated protein 1-like isoform X1 [Hypanus sabinus]